MKKQATVVTGNNLVEFISSLKDRDASLLIVDTRRCKHSQRLVEEMRIATSLASTAAEKASVVHVLDLSEQPLALDKMAWLPGVPCLLAAARVHLGVDAFARCREMCRSSGGVTLHQLALAG